MAVTHVTASARTLHDDMPMPGPRRPDPARPRGEAADAAPVESGRKGVASGRDAAGLPLHRGWAPAGARRRWMEPFILVLLAEGPAHGYAIVGQLGEMAVAPGELDLAAVYRTLRDLEADGHVTSSWSVDRPGPQRREYELTQSGYRLLDEWSAVMQERARLAAEFDARFLAAVAVRRRSGPGRG